jgi:ABC-2 type transport system permease protein
MIKSLFLLNIKENKVLIIAFSLIGTLYATVSIGMYDPSSAEALTAMLELLPEAMIRMMGFDQIGGDITNYVSNYLYGFIMLIFPVIFSIMLGTKLVSKYVDQGSMTYLLTMPYTRRKIVITQAIFFALSLFIIIFFNVIVVIVMAEAMFPNTLDISNFLMLNLVTYAVHLSLASITFLFSVLFGDASRSLGFSGGFLISFFILNMLSSISSETEFLKYFTPFTLIDVEYVLEGNGNGLISFIVMLLISILIFITSIEIFHKKSIII